MPCLPTFCSRWVSKGKVVPENSTVDDHNFDKLQNPRRSSTINTATRTKLDHELALDLKHELEEQFALADVDRNGYIDNNELKKILTNLNMYHTDEEIAEMIHQADINGSGRIEEDDFINMMTDFMAGEKEDEFDVQELFNVFDGDQDGFVTFDELQSVLHEVLKENVPTRSIIKMIKEATGGASSRISYEDFQKLLKNVGFLSESANLEA